MAIPEGYSFLAKLGISYKGDYSETATYEQFNAVYYNGSTYIALVDSPAGPPTADGANWQYMAQGFLSQVISSLTATDKNGVIGEAGSTVNAQNLIDGMSDDIKEKLDKTGDASDTIVTFEQASERTNIISGESHKTIFEKIKKWFADMTAAAFAQIITSNTDLMATTVAGYLVDALAVKQQFEVVNSNLQNKANWNNNISATSFNDLTSPGICINNLEYRPSDIPDDWACVTLVYANSLSVIQIANFMYGDSNKVYMRIRWYDKWRQWTLLS